MTKKVLKSSTKQNNLDQFIINLPIDGMTCASCVSHVEKAIYKLPNIDEVSVNLATNMAFIKSKQAPDITTIKTAIEKAGYSVTAKKIIFNIDGMTCASCVSHVEKAFKNTYGVQNAVVNLATKRAYIDYIGDNNTIKTMEKAVEKSGYKAKPISEEKPEINNEAHETKNLWNAFIVALILTLPVFIIEMTSHIIPAFHHWVVLNLGEMNNRLFQFICATLIVFGPGYRFLKAGIPALFHGHPNMNSLVGVGALTAWGYSTFATFAGYLLPTGANHVYFEAAAVIVTLILLGRWLETGARGRTSQSIRALASLKPKTARVEVNGQTHEIPLQDVEIGNLIIIRPGEKLPVDGIIIKGASYIDESMMTGEPIAIAKNIGDQVFAGSVNGKGSFTFRAEKIGADTLIAHIQKMVEDAQTAKLPIQAIVDKVTAVFVPVIFGTAALTFFIWLLIGGMSHLAQAIVASVSVLIIACPCAMGLATPTSIMVATGQGAKLGILFRKGDALQSLNETKLIAFDKTGTLTLGKPKLVYFEAATHFNKDHVLELVASIEEKSEHPLAKAILDAAKEKNISLLPVDDFDSKSGYGLSGVVKGKNITIGNARFMQSINANIDQFTNIAQSHAKDGMTLFYAAINGQTAAIFGVADPIKPDALKTITALDAMHIDVAMITGDNHITAKAIAQKLKIKHVEADILPEGKLTAVQHLQQQAQKVAFVGDGINDAPALATADTGIAIGTGTDVAIESADIVLMSGALIGVINAIALSRATIKNIKENLFWAFIYNIALIPIAAGILYPLWGILLSPMLAAGAMALSSIFVLTNALRLKNFKSVL